MMFGKVLEGGQSQEPVLVVFDNCESKRVGRHGAVMRFWPHHRSLHEPQTKVTEI